MTSTSESCRSRSARQSAPTRRRCPASSCGSLVALRRPAAYFHKEVVELREVFSDAGHKRTADVMAQLLAAWRIWLRFVVAIKAVTQEESEKCEADILVALHGLAAEQDALQKAADPVDQVVGPATRGARRR